MGKRTSRTQRVDNEFIEGLELWEDKYGYPKVELSRMIGQAMKQEKIVLKLPEVSLNKSDIKPLEKKKKLGAYSNWDLDFPEN